MTREWNWKKVLSLALAIIMAVDMVPWSGLRAYANTEEGEVCPHHQHDAAV